ncbi:hypothetical protein CORC01_05691 [Colletotrichum orchidophilum]|uniref:Small secreted protein n=1 Tax=Colletotrichum orchidophilum TaxID=1209926 RepID=A0A1G4BC87_9PEZI|nr:uncharacterized protein CORC01_05691 [Colletotrichum orchidophilum]OHE99001.1 hypothetical protein CORC01_05691 [Colletotrichum orchidophilum]
MRYTQLILSLFLFFTFVIALPAPAPVDAVAARDTTDKNNKDGDKATKSKNNNNKGDKNKSKATKNNGNDKPTKEECDAAKKLASGIKKNIDIQNQELKDLSALKKTLTGSDTSGFAAAKTKLAATVDSGIKQRVENQSIMLKNSAARDGLAKVEKAQGDEKKLVAGLKGDKSDLDTITTLEGDFKGGIKQNEQNRKDALKGC